METEELQGTRQAGLAARGKGINIMEQLMQEAPAEYHEKGIDDLCIYLRLNTLPARNAQGHWLSVEPLRRDVQKALAVLRRRKKRAVEPPIEVPGRCLAGAALTRVDLQGAVLQGANLQGALLIEANLQGARLEGANLQDTQLAGANLQNAVLSGACNLTKAQLMSAEFASLRLPDGTWAYREDLEALPGAELEQGWPQDALKKGNYVFDYP